MSVTFTRDEENVRKTNSVFRLYFNGDDVLNGDTNIANFRLPGGGDWIFSYGGINFSDTPTATVYTPVFIITGQGTSHQIGSLAGDGTDESNFYQPEQELYLLPADRVYLSVATNLSTMAYTNPETYSGFLSFRR